MWIVVSLAFAASVTPSLYPRPRVVQGVLSGVAVALGLGVSRIGARLLRRVPRVPTGPRGVTGHAALLLSLVIAAWALVVNHRWQVDVRRLMAIEGNPAWDLAAAVAVAVAVAAFWVLGGRLVRRVTAAAVRLATQVVPRRRSLRHAAVAVVLAGLVAGFAIESRVVAGVNGRFVAAAASTERGLTPPRSEAVSGSPASLVDWDSLGRMGRRFVATVPTTAELRAFVGARVRPPIRVYVGLESAPSIRARVELALAELERTGAFDRDVLVVVNPTGTGAVNRYALAPLEHMYGGDTAAVAVQYSYLPSWVVMTGNQDRATTAARALLDGIDRRLRRLPPSGRPRILLYGESLGSFGSEQAFADLPSARALTDGVLWVGPTRANRLWRRFTTDRDAGSPEWRPVYRDGRSIRFATRGADTSLAGEPWRVPRIAYVQHPSDPVTWWTPDLLLTRPAWLRDPRPPGISDRTPYVPIVTFVQTSIDTVLGGSAPLGHGHRYGPEHTDAWAEIAPPGGWTATDTARLRTVLTDRIGDGQP